MITPSKEDICYATKIGRMPVKQLAREVDLVLGSVRVIAKTQTNFPKWRALTGRKRTLLTIIMALIRTGLSGLNGLALRPAASVPERLVQETVDFFTQQGAEIAYLGFVEENIHFALPPEFLTETPPR